MRRICNGRVCEFVFFIEYLENFTHIMKRDITKLDSYE